MQKASFNDKVIKCWTKGRSKSKKSDVFWLWLRSRRFTWFEQKLRVAFLLHDEWFLDERMIYMWMGLNGPKTHPGPAIRSICDPFRFSLGLSARSIAPILSHRTRDFKGLVGLGAWPQFRYQAGISDDSVFWIAGNKRTSRRHYLHRAANDFHYEF